MKTHFYVMHPCQQAFSSIPLATLSHMPGQTSAGGTMLQKILALSEDTIDR